MKEGYGVYGKKYCKCGKEMSTSDVTKDKCDGCHIREISAAFDIPTKQDITRLKEEVEAKDKAMDRAVFELSAFKVSPKELCKNCTKDCDSDQREQCWREYLTTPTEPPPKEITDAN